MNWRNTYDSKTPDKPKSWFANEDYNKNFVRYEQRRAHAWSDEFYGPAAVRYAWSQRALCNLFTESGLPASPFHTDDWAIQE